MKKNEVFYKSLKITLLYVGVGSLNLLLLKSDSIFVSIIAIITMPVCFLGFGILYADFSLWWLVVLIQIVIFLIFWYVLYQYFLKKIETYGDEEYL